MPPNPPAAFSNCHWRERLLLLAARWGGCRGGGRGVSLDLIRAAHPARRSTSLPSSPWVSAEPLTAPGCFTINHRKAVYKPYCKEQGPHYLFFVKSSILVLEGEGRHRGEIPFFRSHPRFRLPSQPRCQTNASFRWTRLIPPQPPFASLSLSRESYKCIWVVRQRLCWHRFLTRFVS